MRFLSIAVFLFFCCVASLAQTQTVIASERNYSLRQLDNTALLFDYHGQTVGGKRQFFTYPRRNNTFVHGFIESERGALIFHADSFDGDNPVSNLGIAVSPVAGFYYYDGDGVVRDDSDGFESEAGFYVRGYADSLDFDLDVRAYSGDRSADGAEELVRYRG